MSIRTGITRFLLAIGVTAMLVLGTYFVHNAIAQEKDSTHMSVTKVDEKISKQNLGELSKCESDLSKDDGQLTSADVQDCYSQIFSNSNHTATH